MTVYNVADGLTLLTGATDREGDTITVYDCESVDMVGVTTPTLVKTVTDVADIYCTEAGAITVDLLDADAAPLDTVTEALTTITFRLWDGTTVGASATRTINLTGEAAPAASAYDATGLVAWWDAESYTSGAWVDEVSSRSATAVGTPTTGTPPGGTASQSVAIGAGAGFTCATLTSFPTGTADRTLMFVGRLTGGFGYAGFGYGTNSAGQAFTASIDNLGELALDVAATRIGLGISPGTEWQVFTARVSSGTLSIWLGAVPVYSGAFSGNTGATLINFCRTFSGNTTTGDLGDCLVWGRALSDTEIRAAVATANARFIGDADAGVLGTIAGSSITAGGFDFGGTTPVSYGRVAWAVKSGTGAMTEAEILAGTGAVTSGAFTLDNAAAWTGTVAGLTGSTDYRVHAICYGIDGAKSAVANSATVTTAGSAAAAPVLSGLGGSIASTGSGTIFATTDSANGSAILGVLPAAAAAPNAAQLAAGTDGADNPIQTVAIASITGTSLSVAVTGLTPGSSYKTVAIHTNSEGTASLVYVQAATFTVPIIAATVREQVEGLATGVTRRGRTSVNTLKTLGELPTSVTLGSFGNMNYLTFTADDVSLVDYDLTNCMVTTNNRTRPTISESIFEYALNPSLSSSMLTIPPGSHDATISYCTMRGFNGGPARGSQDKQIILHEHNQAGAAATCATGVILEGLFIDRYNSDGIHTAGGGIIFRDSYIGPPRNLDNPTTIWSGSGVGISADDCVDFNSGGFYYRILCLQDNPTTAPIKGTNTADWLGAGTGMPHSDMLNPRASIGTGSTFERLFFWDDDQSGDGLYAAGINNWMRLVRNTGRLEPMQNITIRNCLNNRVNSGVTWPVQLATGTNVTGPVDVIDNWCGQRGKVPFTTPSGWWTGGGGLIGTWSGNVDATTGVAIPAP